MTPQEYAQLSNVRPELHFCLDQLVNKTPRTLFYGYTAERETWHVYLDEAGVIHRIVYDSKMLLSHQAGGFKRNSELIPGKRLYPEHCDFEACALFTKASESLPFTTMSEDRVSELPFHGKTFEELKNLNTVKFDLNEIANASNGMPDVACVAVVEAALQLGVAYRKNEDAVYIHTDDAQSVYDLMQALLPEASAMPDPQGWVRNASAILAPYSRDSVFELGVSQEGGHLIGILELVNDQFTDVVAGYSVKQAPSGFGYFMYRMADKEPFASLTPYSRQAGAKFIYTERLFGRQLLDPADTPHGKLLKSKA